MVELIAKKFYENLGKKKLMGLKCKKCGTYTFPPKPTCNKCGNTKLDWAEMSGRGKLHVYTVLNYPGGEFQDMAPYAYGMVDLKEGIPYFTIIKGVDIKDPWKGNSKLPIDVVASIEKVKTKTIVVFKPAK